MTAVPDVEAFRGIGRVARPASAPAPASSAPVPPPPSSAPSPSSAASGVGARSGSGSPPRRRGHAAGLALLGRASGRLSGPLVALALGLGLVACEGRRSAGAPGSAVESSAGDLGPPTVRLYLLSDVAGALEPCGCTKDQLGGLNHFGAWVKRERTQAPRALVASAGPLFFMDDKLEGERADQDRAKAETIARVLKGLDFAAFAPGANDWTDGRGGLLKLATVSGATVIDDLPAAKVAAGALPLADAAAPSPLFASVLVRDVGGVKIGFVGYGQPGADAGDVAGPDVEGAIARGVATAKEQGANVLIALAAVGRGEAKRIADAVPELTAVVVGGAKSRGDGNTSASEAEPIGNVLIVQAANHLQSVAVLDLYVRDPVAPGKVLKFADATGLERAQRREDLSKRIDDLHVKIAAWERDPHALPADVQARKATLADLERQRDALDVKPPPARGSFYRYSLKEIRDALGKDPGIESDMLAYYKAVDERNRVAFADRRPRNHGVDEPIYVGTDACVDCHLEPVEVWRHTAHARAYETLASQFKEYNLDCVGCHVTGYERPGGSTVTHVEKLKDVQCEVCHGPGSKHVIAPLDAATIIAKPQPGVCLDCHHPPHVEGFDPALKMKEILGPGHGLKG
jgi:2',3'-cyclic-nucleotide 2'-phosphodiesterase (5'-nucleotidase family)